MTKPTEADIRTILTGVSPGVSWEEVGADESISDAGLDSLDKANVLLKVEEDYGIHIPDEEYDELDTIAQVISSVAAKQG